MLTLVTPPTPFVSLQEAKRHLRVDHNDDDQTINSLIKVAIADLDGPDGRLGRALGLQTWDWIPDCFANPFKVPLPPLVNVINIKNGDGVVVDAAMYKVLGINTTRGGRISLIGSTWPTEVVIRFQAGYANVPEPVRQAVLLMIGQLYVTGGENVNASLVEEPAIARLLARFWVPRV